MKSGSERKGPTQEPSGRAPSIARPLPREEKRPLPVGKRPWGVALSRDGTTLYTADGRSNQISVIDTRTMRVRGTAAVGERPYTVLLVP